MKTKEKITPKALFIDFLLLMALTTVTSKFWILINPLLNARPVVNIIGIPVSTRFCVDFVIIAVSFGVFLSSRHFIRKLIKID